MQDLSITSYATYSYNVQQGSLALCEDVLPGDNTTFKQGNGLLSLQN